MTLISSLARYILVLHGLLNVAQGIYSLVSPLEYASLAGEMFAGAPEKALKSVGLGAIGVGLYQTVFAYQRNRTLIGTTILMRLFFASVIYDWGSKGAVAYEISVVMVCGLALL